MFISHMPFQSCYSFINIPWFIKCAYWAFHMLFGMFCCHVSSQEYGVTYSKPQSLHFLPLRPEIFSLFGPRLGAKGIITLDELSPPVLFKSLSSILSKAVFVCCDENKKQIWINFLCFVHFVQQLKEWVSGYFLVIIFWWFE